MLELEFILGSNPEYIAIRDRHYVAKALAERRDTEEKKHKVGSHGQHIPMLIRFDNQVIGAIDGGAAIFSAARRDDYFGFPKDDKKRANDYRQAIVDNTLFRLEAWPEPKLATRVLKLWRPAVAELWEAIYGVPAIGFETFVDGVTEEGQERDGYIYRADHWKCLGRTKGRTKQHTSGEGLIATREHVSTTPKLMFVKRIPGVTPAPYEGGWDWNKKLPNGEFKWDEETRARKRALRDKTTRRAALLGQKFQESSVYSTGYGRL